MRSRSTSFLFFTLAALSPFAQGAEAKIVESQARRFVLSGSAPITVPGKVGHFDFMALDSVNDRILAAHSGAGTLEIIDLKTGKLISPIEVGDVQGVAVDSESNTYILGDADEHKIVFVNAKTLKKTGELKVSGPVDAIAVDFKNGLAYAGEDDGSHVWVIDVKEKKLVATIPISGVPEFIVFDPKTNRLYQNIKTKDVIAVINPDTNKVETEWSTLPSTGPHGLALDTSTGHLFVAGHNGKLVEVEIKTGRVISQTEITPGTDQISFDDSTKNVYCASKGFTSVVQETDSGLKLLGETPTAPGTHTLSVDSRRHEIWVSYADKAHSYLQKFRSTGDARGNE